MSKTIHVVTIYHDWEVSVWAFSTAEKAKASAFAFINKRIVSAGYKPLPESIRSLDGAIAYADGFGALDGRLVQIDECQIDEVAP